MKGKLLMYSVLLYMVGELLLGSCVGLVVKYVAKFGAAQSSDTRVFVAKDYSSTYFGKNFPRAAFDPFQLPREFIIVQYVNDEVVSEEFFTFLGDSTKAIYQNGQYRGHGYSVLSSPVYFFTVLIPIMLGFFTAFLPFIRRSRYTVIAIRINLDVFNFLANAFVYFWRSILNKNLVH